MTKRELVQMLEQYSDDTLIIVDGHSDGDGFNEASTTSIFGIVKDDSWRGEYREPLSIDSNIRVIEAILIR